MALKAGIYVINNIAHNAVLTASTKFTEEGGPVTGEPEVIPPRNQQWVVIPSGPQRMPGKYTIAPHSSSLEGNFILTKDVEVYINKPDGDEPQTFAIEPTKNGSDIYTIGVPDNEEYFDLVRIGEPVKISERVLDSGFWQLRYIKPADESVSF